MRVAILTAVALACAACGEEERSRLNMIDVDPDGTEVWSDNERSEVCAAYATEENGTRCFPRFTRVYPSDLRYADSACETLAVWVDLERPKHAYVAYVANDERLVYSIFKIIEKIESPDGGVVEPHAWFDNKCGPYPIESIRSTYKITTRIHPEEFSPVEM